MHDVGMSVWQHTCACDAIVNQHFARLAGFSVPDDKLAAARVRGRISFAL
jgi:predicted metal-dependent peptidase